MTISMHGDVLADSDSGYQFTVNVPSYPSGTSTLGVSITTANGYTDHANLATPGVTSWTFKIPANQGSTVQVCVNSDTSSAQNCNTYNTAGSDISVSLSPPSGNTYYVYPGNTYYVYPGNSYDYYHHDRDHWLGGHQDSGNNAVGGGHRNVGNGGNQNSGNIGSGNNGNGGNLNNGNNGYVPNQNNGNTGYVGHQGHWLGGNQNNGNIGYGGHQNSGNNGFGSGKNVFSGNRGVTHPDHLHHLTKGVPIINAESSDDDSDSS